ncbi:hypothetical protein C8F04DRAFT_739610 [Mycena alexandri]|uniref:BTB domain-containing protein n=1 Tax=Mycena alexandri TaxID=1745969 RepID=A0AAD6SQI4_9AGAR|nr:hypothetical protein C8F04DRAFT_739610 [Mycena alexandri]
MATELVFQAMRDSKYYLDTIVFKVENAFFRVPRWQFENNSGIFATTFSLPHPEEKGEGSDDEHPFHLDGITRVEFQTFLKVLYPLSAVPKTPTLSPTEWTSVLKLASLWDFIEVRDFAIKELLFHAESLDCVARILLGRQYDVSAWIRSGYTELARRRTPITSAEAMKIGYEVALQISHLREAAVATGLTNNPFSDADLGTAFDAELKRADSAHEPLPRLPPVQATKALLGAIGAAAPTNPAVAKRKVSPTAPKASSSPGTKPPKATFSFTTVKSTLFNGKPIAAPAAGSSATNAASGAGPSASTAPTFGQGFVFATSGIGASGASDISATTNNTSTPATGTATTAKASSS